MLTFMAVDDFTVFRHAEFDFRSVNVIHGENGAGKTHLLKLAYATLASRFRFGTPTDEPTKSALETGLADKLVGVFRPDSLGGLVRRGGGGRCRVTAGGLPGSGDDLVFEFGARSKSAVSLSVTPTAWLTRTPPVYLPTRELMTIFPNFLSVYEQHYLEFEETWRDLCVLLGGLPKRGAAEQLIRNQLVRLEEAMGGQVELDKTGRFYLVSKDMRLEMPLVAEGIRKLAMLARVIATGAFLKPYGGFLFWDEPEANLNPRLVKLLPPILMDLATRGVQVFIATHSLFLMRELQVVQQTKYPGLPVRYFGLQREATGVGVNQGDEIEDSGDIAALDEQLEQSDRYLEMTWANAGKRPTS